MATKERAINGTRGGGGGTDLPLRFAAHQVDEIPHVATSDHPSMQLVATQLGGTNFVNWSQFVRRALGAKCKLELLIGSFPNVRTGSRYYKQWLELTR